MGKKRTWILLRGLAHESAHWMEFTDMLRQAFPEDDVIGVDLMGTGVHFREKAPLAMERYVELARQDALALAPPPYRLISLSMGAMAAYGWERIYPQEIEAMVLMAPSFRNFSPFYKRLRWQVYPELLLSLFSRDPLKREKRFLKIISNNFAKHETAAHIRKKIRDKRPVSFMNTIRQLVACSRCAATRGPPGCPALLLSGSGDRMVAPECAEAIKKAWNIPHKVHPWAGHNLTLDDPDWVLEQIMDAFTNTCLARYRQFG